MKNYALIGEKLGYSLSPIIHSKILAHNKIRGNYTIFEIPLEESPKTLSSLYNLGFHGINITSPYKISFLHEMDIISPLAKKVGAINTVRINKEGFSGTNTDIEGFVALVNRNNIIVKNQKVTVLGTGGAALSTAFSLMEMGCSSITFVSRSLENTTLLDCPVVSYQSLIQGDIIINATPIGTKFGQDISPIASSLLEKFTIALDLVYNPIETIFVREAKSLGLKADGGLWMLIEQALAAQTFWNGLVFEEEFKQDLYNSLVQELNND